MCILMNGVGPTRLTRMVVPSTRPPSDAYLERRRKDDQHVQTQSKNSISVFKMSSEEVASVTPFASLLAVRIRRFLMRRMLAMALRVNDTDKEGRTVLHINAKDGMTYLGSVAISRGADVNCRDKNMQTPLHAASYASHPEFVEMLVAQPGVLRDARDVSGWTALHWCCYVGKADVSTETVSKHHVPRHVPGSSPWSTSPLSLDGIRAVGRPRCRPARASGSPARPHTLATVCSTAAGGRVAHRPT